MKPEFDESALCDRCTERIGCYKIGEEWLCDDCYEDEILEHSNEQMEDDE